MTFTELISEVMTVTNRPDLVNETKMAIRSATLAAHQSDFYPRDIVEQPISFTNPDYLISFTYLDIFPLWRRLKYIRQYDPSASSADGALGKFLDIITPESSLDSFGYNKTDVCYLAGTAIQIRNFSPQQYFLLGYYTNPDITDAGYNSWIAVTNPYVIVFFAVAQVFGLVGQADQKSAYIQMYQQQLQQLKISALELHGE